MHEIWTQPFHIGLSWSADRKAVSVTEATAKVSLELFHVCTILIDIAINHDLMINELSLAVAIPRFPVGPCSESRWPRLGRLWGSTDSGMLFSRRLNQKGDDFLTFAICYQVLSFRAKPWNHDRPPHLLRSLHCPLSSANFPSSSLEETSVPQSSQTQPFLPSQGPSPRQKHHPPPFLPPKPSCCETSFCATAGHS